MHKLIKNIDYFLSSQLTIALSFFSFIYLFSFPFIGLNILKDNAPYSLLPAGPFLIVIYLLFVRISYGMFYFTVIMYKIKKDPSKNDFSNSMVKAKNAFSVKSFARSFNIPVRASYIVLEMFEKSNTMERFYMSKGREFSSVYEIPKGELYTTYFKLNSNT